MIFTKDLETVQFYYRSIKHTINCFGMVQYGVNDKNQVRVQYQSSNSPMCSQFTAATANAKMGLTTIHGSQSQIITARRFDFVFKYDPKMTTFILDCESLAAADQKKCENFRAIVKMKNSEYYTVQYVTSPDFKPGSVLVDSQICLIFSNFVEERYLTVNIVSYVLGALFLAVILALAIYFLVETFRQIKQLKGKKHR